MRTIIRIARQELSTLFYSPVAWLILMVFPIQVGLEFAHYILMLGRSQRMGNNFVEVTNIVFASQNGFYPGVKDTLYFYIPLLTMGLISRELHSGSIKLLLSSPIKVRDIVLGKYLAMMGYGLILLMIIGLFGVSGSFFIDNIDYLQIMSGALGLYLLICAYASIGLFMSSLTSYQVVAAICTLAILGLLSFVGGLFQGNDVVRHITYFLSISGRTEQFISGLISSEDVVYFLLIITFFLTITGMRLQAGRETRSARKKLLRYTLLIAVFVLVGYISSRPHLTGYIDMTRMESRTLSDRSVEFIGQMDKPLKITTFVNVMDNNFYLGAPEKKSADERLFNQYRRFIPDLEMEYVYYYDFSDNRNLNRSNKGVNLEDMARKVADIQNMDFNELLSPSEIRKRFNPELEENRLVRLLEYGDRSTFLRYFDDFMIHPSEQEITAAIKRLLDPEKIPKVTFLTGHEERSMYRQGDADFRRATAELTYRYSLVNQGFDVDTVNLTFSEIPERTVVLVIADPKTALTETEWEKLNLYLQGGGNLFVLAEKGNRTNLNPVLNYLSVEIADSLVKQQTLDFSPDLVQALFTPESASISPRFTSLQKDSAVVTMPGVSPLQYRGNDYQVSPLLKDGKGLPLAIALERSVGGKNQKIVISGDADFMSTAELTRRKPETRNFALVSQLFSWFSDGEFPVNTAKQRINDHIDSDNKSVLLLRLFFFGLLPLCFLITGSILLIYRKRR